MENLATVFYKDLFSDEGTSGMEDVNDKVPTKVTTMMNDQLHVPYSNDQVKKAIFQMFPTKASGPDGYPAHFFTAQLKSRGRRGH